MLPFGPFIKQISFNGDVLLNYDTIVIRQTKTFIQITNLNIDIILKSFSFVLDGKLNLSHKGILNGWLVVSLSNLRSVLEAMNIS